MERSTIDIDAALGQQWTEFCEKMLPGLAGKRGRGARIKYTSATVEWIMGDPKAAVEIAKLAMQQGREPMDRRSSLDMEYSLCQDWTEFCEAALPGLTGKRGIRITYTSAAIRWVMGNPKVALKIARLAIEQQLPQPLEGDQLEIDFESAALPA